ncbi:AbrB/MazE/SpoVT family DNA-binding domain-containing protein [Deinococcus hopiensis]|uniref:Antidote-toxin recognition MazE, antitoxin n=1 Tax=Deinococcus hopiensis KR-140 TaxID=695939 RepID=A0A1W1UAE0_9DEIO|nr:AbrB/MazE/SpoVT family DNA-binding domain-containing protein [Deinococcus hopiensis]SMB77781.1 Antidote-toxin recognition MazE, antitoxin [Deinococcus hopiensis KR-140]
MTESVTTEQKVYSGQLGPKYRVILPRAVRDALHVEEGDTLMYVVEGERVQLTTRRQLAQELYGSLAEGDGRDFTQEHLEERRAEAQREKP